MRKALPIWLALALGLVACSGRSTMAGPTVQAPANAQSEGSPEALSPAGEQELRKIVQDGKLGDLQWPNFSNHAASVKEFYDETGYKLGWIRGGKPTAQALELIGILEQAENKGLNSKDYDGERWPDRVKVLQAGNAGGESERLGFDVALTVSGIRYISDLHLGRVDPEALHKDFDPERQHHDPGAFLSEEVIHAQSVKGALAPLECPYPGYQRALLALQKYLEMAKREVPDPLPQVKKPIGPGQVYEGSEKLVRRLQFLGDLPASAVATNSSTYSTETAEGVKRFQVRHGMDADGKLGPQTIAELNQPMSDRVQQLKLSLERRRR